MLIVISSLETGCHAGKTSQRFGTVYPAGSTQQFFLASIEYLGVVGECSPGNSKHPNVRDTTRCRKFGPKMSDRCPAVLGLVTGF